MEGFGLFVAFVAIISLSWEGVDGTLCYSCIDCGEGKGQQIDCLTPTKVSCYKSTTTALVTETIEESLRYHGPLTLNDWLLEKPTVFLYKQFGIYVVNRGCHYINEDAGQCKVGAQGAHVCYCNTDLCNSSTPVKSTVLSAFLALTFVRLVVNNQR